MDGILVADKPLGWTSHDVVAVCRRQAGHVRTGHGGTLDPLARGVLPILFGPATKFSDRLHAATKVYCAEIAFGNETATDDREGAVTREAPSPATLEEIQAALAAFVGTISQVPPDYAAVKVRGRTAYKRARAGETLVLEPRSVRIDRFEVVGWRAPVARALIVCSSGTYIRSLARDLGRATGSAAHLAALTRLAVGSLELAGATGIEQIRSATLEELSARLIAAGDGVLPLDARFLSEPADGLVGAWEA